MSFERNAINESQQASDSSAGFLGAWDQAFADTLKEVNKVQCESLGSKPAEDLLPKAEMGKDEKGEFITFSALAADGAAQKGADKVQDIGDWLDSKTRLKKAQAA